MKTTFTQEAIRDIDPTRLGELIKDRAAKGVRTFEVVPIDEAIGRLAAMGVPVVGELPAIEVESRYPAPTPEEVEELASRISATGYASEATEVVEAWLEERYGVVSTYRAKARAELALHNVEEAPGGRVVLGRLLVDGVRLGKMTIDPVGLEPGETVDLEIEGMRLGAGRPAADRVDAAAVGRAFGIPASGLLGVAIGEAVRHEEAEAIRERDRSIRSSEVEDPLEGRADAD